MVLNKISGRKLPPREKAMLEAFSLYFQGKDFVINDKSSKLDCQLSNKILIGTHHKTGTVWLLSILKEICDYYSLVFYRSWKASHSPSNFDIFLQDHSQFDFDSLKAPYRGMHIIRDPRDVIVSACFYHQKSSEGWLHESREKWQGLTYHQKINSYDHFDDQLLFEMENATQHNIKQILNWDYNNPHFYEIKYEKLIEDVDLILFHQIFSFLGFPGSVIPNLLMIAYQNSLFSGKVKSAHVRSGNKSQWEQYFKPIHKKRFIELFGDCLVKLGYEDNDQWASKVDTL